MTLTSTYIGLDPVTIGLAIGRRAPLGLPTNVLASTLRSAIARETPDYAAAQYPTKPKMWPWWLGYAGTWVVLFTLIGVTPKSTGAATLYSMLGFFLALGAILLIMVGRARRDGHAAHVGLIAEDAREAAAAFREEVFTHAWAEAHRPGRAAPPHALAPVYPRPTPQPYGVSHAGAEQLVAEWMRYLGVLDAEVTRVSGDGGVDVVSATHIAQVKNLAATATVPVAQIRELAGVAAHDGRIPAFFSSASYSAGGVEFADRADMGLFIYDAPAGTLRAANHVGQLAIDHGLQPRI